MSGIDDSITLFKLLNVSSVTSLLDGKVYRYNRPVNSSNRDVVISTPEPGIADINVHVPNLVQDNDQTSPDLKELDKITDAILARVSGYEIVNDGLPQRDKDGHWFSNIRIKYGPGSGIFIPVTIWAMSVISDGYGGAIPSFAQVWSGSAVKFNESVNNQMEVLAGRYEITPRNDWHVPKAGYTPQKYMQIRTSEGTYVINGIIPDGSNWRVSTERVDRVFA